MSGESTAAGRMSVIVRVALLAVVAALQIGLSSAPLITHHGEYRPAWAADAAFAALALVTAVSAVPVLRGRPLPPVVVAPGTAVVLLASAAATLALPPGGQFSTPDWSFGLIGWHLMLLLLDRLPLFGAALATHVAMTVGHVVATGPSDRAAVGGAGIVVLGVTTFQLAAVAIARVLHRRAGQADELAAQRDRLVTGAALAEQRQLDQRARFAGQLGATLPLLAGLADRTLDPREDDVRHRCAVVAAQLRRLFAENDEVPDPLVHEVSACVDAAERWGLSVSLAVSGDAVPVPTAVRRELTGPVVAALARARSRARVSVLRTEEEVRVAVVCDAEGPGPRPAGSPEVEVTCHAHGQQTWTEARWRSHRTAQD
ncbi:hypothetical protein [Umezawaea beigongshangensis]|uniref:hypothetical protein n=1 Tax=Umezawaea beigongshangensis TaxID=2780383 RepID=UPI001E4503AA|nr:hypothetical protein [Umezawaea beigongshangensis]